MQKQTPLPFSSNVLKIIAAVSMLIDHIGFIFFPSVTEFRVVGRLAFPIFAFFIAVGCKYTKNKLRYFLQILGLGSVFQAVFYIFTKDTRLNIFLTFSLAMAVVFPLQNLKFVVLKKKGILKILLSGAIFVASICFVNLFCRKFTVDYGFWGCMIPVFASLFMLPRGFEDTKYALLDKSYVHIVPMALGLIFLSLNSFTLQFYSLFSLPLLALYSGERGKLNLKYFFYVFYPAHLVLLYGIFMAILHLR